MVSLGEADGAVMDALARRLIEGVGQGVSQAAFAVGCESPTQFSREFSRMFGRAPCQFKPEAAGT